MCNTLSFICYIWSLQVARWSSKMVKCRPVFVPFFCPVPSWWMWPTTTAVLIYCGPAAVLLHHSASAVRRRQSCALRTNTATFPAHRHRHSPGHRSRSRRCWPSTRLDADAPTPTISEGTNPGRWHPFSASVNIAMLQISTRRGRGPSRRHLALEAHIAKLNYMNNKVTNWQYRNSFANPARSVI